MACSGNVSKCLAVLAKCASEIQGDLRNIIKKRKSNIYRGRPRFSIFGIGEYSFKPYKVAISGLYKQPRFSLVLPIDNRPVMIDDTCYFLGFDTYLEGLFTASVLNSSTVKRFLQSIVFVDAKRPYTKEVLMRIELVQATLQLLFDALCSCWADIGYEPKLPLTEADFEEYKEHLSHTGEKNLQLNLDM